MPTYYTADLHSGDESFKAFVKRCTNLSNDYAPRATSLGYHLNHVARAQSRLDELRGMTSDDKVTGATKSNAEAFRINEEYLESKDRVKARYTAMLEKVMAWDAPEVLQPTRDFMIEQLNYSIEYDCRVSAYEPEELTPDEWHENEMDGARRDLIYYRKKYDETKAALENRAAVEKALNMVLESND